MRSECNTLQTRERVLYTGNCLCGGVSFRVEQKLEPIQVCHCSQCRKAQGTPFATNMPISASAFRLISGHELLRAFESSPGKKRVFCSTCGSPIFSESRNFPGVVRIRAGLINEPLPVKPIAHFYTASKCNWWPIDDGLPQFPEAYAVAVRAGLSIFGTICANMTDQSRSNQLADEQRIVIPKPDQ